MFLFSLVCRETDVIPEYYSLTKMFYNYSNSKNTFTVITKILNVSNGKSTNEITNNLLHLFSEVRFFCIHVRMM